MAKLLWVKLCVAPSKNHIISFTWSILRGIIATDPFVRFNSAHRFLHGMPFCAKSGPYPN